MFLDLFYGLREQGVPVSIHEWKTFARALEEGLHGCSLERFYHLARACLVKSETHFDAYDRVFAHVFKGVEGALGEDVTEKVLEWLRDPKNFPNLSPEELAQLERLSADELMRRFLETLAEQTERHDGGGRWIGTGGRSPFGHGGQHPTGIRVGGKSRGRSAMKIAEQRRFKNYRTDLALDVRQIKVSLRRLRQLTRLGEETELDLDETVDETCRNAGEIELVFRAPRRNNVRLLLMMDVGGTMEPYYEPVSRLLTALHEEHSLREFRPYYFHNCVYDYVYSSARMQSADAVPTGDILRRFNQHWKAVFVGDAGMHPAELFDPYGSIDPRLAAETPGIVWLQRIARHFERAAWINPEKPAYWEGSHSARTIGRLFPMFHLSVDGLTEAVQALVGSRAHHGPAPQT